MARLQDRVVLITGGGSGVGRATAQLFLQEGAKVAISGRDANKLAQAAQELAGGEHLLTVPADVGDFTSVKNLVQTVTQQLGPIAILVNNAGTNIKARTMRELSVENWELLIRSNLNGAFYCIHEVLPGMLQRRDGVIVNISSVAGKRGNPLGGAAYVASKFGMTGLGMCLSNEERDSGIRVSNIYPGEIDTPILAARPVPVTEEQRAKILKPEDVAAAVLFVATLPPHVSVPELVIKPTSQMYY